MIERSKELEGLFGVKCPTCKCDVSLEITIGNYDFAAYSDCRNCGTFAKYRKIPLKRKNIIT